MPKQDPKHDYSNFQAFFLVGLRILLGWYFLYEGVTKLANPDWSAVGYLMDSKGPFSGIFLFLGSDPDVVSVVDWLNMWGLTLVGFGLLLGLFTQLSLAMGMVLLILYYLSHPALPSVTYMMPQEGSYLVVNKTLIEIVALAVLYVFPSGKVAGLDRLIYKWIRKP